MQTQSTASILWPSPACWCTKTAHNEANKKPGLLQPLREHTYKAEVWILSKVFFFCCALHGSLSVCAWCERVHVKLILEISSLRTLYIFTGHRLSRLRERCGSFHPDVCRFIFQDISFTSEGFRLGLTSMRLKCWGGCIVFSARATE